MADLDVADIGFESIDQFLGYCDIHCETERGLFNGRQIGRLLRLAGHEELGLKWEAVPDRWHSCDEEDIHPLTAAARAALSQAQGSATHG